MAIATLAVVAVALAAAAPAATGPRSLVLRLPDLGDGYRVGDDSGCGGLGTENAPPSVAQLVIAYRPSGCAMDYERIWRSRRDGRAKRARSVESIAYTFPHAEAAAAALRVGRDFARYVLLDPRGLTPSSERLTRGDEAAVFAKGTHFTVLWRRGAVVALVHVYGRSAAKAKQAGRALSRLQDRRIAKPVPVPSRANDDRDVALDDPRIGVPVYWLGRRFAPDGLPRLTLEDASVNHQPEEGFEMAAIIGYAGRSSGVKLDLWKPRRWERFRTSRLGRQGSWSSNCARRRVVQVPRGRAEIFAGFAPKEGPPPGVTPGRGRKTAVPVTVAACPKRARDDFIAHVYLPRVVVTINMPNCLRCDTEGGRYESVGALTRVVRGLRLRG